MKNKLFIAGLTMTFSISFAACFQKDEMPKPNISNIKPAVNENSIPKTAESSSSNAVNSVTAPTKEMEETKVVFSGEDLPKGWDFIDPDEEIAPELKKEPGFMVWNVKGGKDYISDKQNAPRFLKTVKGDFEIETKVFFDPKASYQGAGLLVFNDKKTYLRLERCFGGVGGGGSGVRFDKSEKGEYATVSSAEKNPTTETETELKIKRVGNEFTTFVKPKGKDWKEVGKITSPFNEEVDVGLIVCNTATEISAKFAYINLKSAK